MFNSCCVNAYRLLKQVLNYLCSVEISGPQTIIYLANQRHVSIFCKKLFFASFPTYFFFWLLFPLLSSQWWCFFLVYQPKMILGKIKIFYPVRNLTRPPNNSFQTYTEWLNKNGDAFNIQYYCNGLASSIKGWLREQDGEARVWINTLSASVIIVMD